MDPRTDAEVIASSVDRHPAGSAVGKAIANQDSVLLEQIGNVRARLATLQQTQRIYAGTDEMQKIAIARSL